MCVFVCVGGDLCEGSLYLCVCVSVSAKEKVMPDLLWTKPPEGDKETHLEPLDWRLD